MTPEEKHSAAQQVFNYDKIFSIDSHVKLLIAMLAFTPADTRFEVEHTMNHAIKDHNQEVFALVPKMIASLKPHFENGTCYVVYAASFIILMSLLNSIVRQNMDNFEITGSILPDREEVSKFLKELETMKKEAGIAPPKETPDEEAS